MRAEEDALYNKYKRLNERRRGLLGLSWWVK
jgi:hypothetical protein